MPSRDRTQHTLDGRSLRRLSKMLREQQLQITNLEWKLNQAHHPRFLPRQTYVARAEEAIEAMAGTTPNHGTVKVFKLKYDLSLTGIPAGARSEDPDGFFRVEAYSTSAIAVDDWVFITRDCFGTWWVVTGASVGDVILDFPISDQGNFLLPGDISGDSYAHLQVINALNYSDIDTTVELVVKDMISCSCFLPGQRGTFRYSSELEAYMPWPFGQNCIQRARTYRDIPVDFVGTAGGIWLTGGLGAEDDIVELSESQYFISYNHATSNIPIEASQDDPREFWVMLTNEGGGVIWNVLVPECNPGSAGTGQ